MTFLTEFLETSVLVNNSIILLRKKNKTDKDEKMDLNNLTMSNTINIIDLREKDLTS